ncbi:TonB-dependent receptor [Novosphingobium sp.]|uniref:TonB-dependent receptor n=1 Tax=Novosphingobium sp. TaxID=1874826 RepID=UPI00286DD769|nr:TonB-dependent receptor [Novosphingobium sp.]
MVAAAVLLPAAPTLAADNNDQAAANEADTTDGSIIVTARRRDERALDVPASVTAMGPEALDRYSTADLSALAGQVPQVKIDRVGFGNGAILNIRGVGSSAVDAAIEQEVTVNIDGMPISRGRVVTQALFDLRTVEVLKGPQALFFGKNSPAGVITLNSANPGSSLEGYVRAGYEFEAQEYAIEGAISIPLSDALRVRIAARHSDMRGGFITNVSGPITDPTYLPYRLVQAGLTLPGAPVRELPGTRETALRFTAVYDPGSNFDATLKFLYTNHKDDGYAQGTVMFNCGTFTKPTTQDFGDPTFRHITDPYGVCGVTATSSVGTVPAAIASRYAASNGGVPYVNVNSYLGSLTMNLALTDAIKLTSVTGYYKYQERGWGAFDYTSMAMASGKNDDGQRSIAQEFRLQSDFESPLNFTAGVYYGDDKRTYTQVGTIGYFGIDPSTGRTESTASDSSFTGKTVSAFGQLIWKLTPQVELSGGARYTHERKTGNMGNVFLNANMPASFVFLPVGTRLIGEFTEENVSPDVTLSWKPQDGVMIFAAYKTGFKSGGFSSPTRYPGNANLVNQRFGQEEVHGFEAGVKLQALDRRLTAEFGAYSYLYEGLQLTAYDGSTSSYFTQNAGSARVKGVEATMSLKITDELTLRTSAAYNSARYKSFPGSQCFVGQTVAEGCVARVQSLTGQRLSRAPDWTTQAGISYEKPISDTWKFGLNGEVRTTSGYYIATNNSPFAWQKAFTLVDLSMRLFSDDWDFALIGKNVGNKIYGVVGNDKPLGQRGMVNGNIGRPREVSLQVTRHF